jgi:hypothetical protein
MMWVKAACEYVSMASKGLYIYNVKKLQISMVPYSSMVLYSSKRKTQ